MKADVHIYKYDAVKMWLLSSILTVSAYAFIIGSPLPINYARAFFDIVNRRIDPKVTWESFFRDVSSKGYPVLNPHMIKQANDMSGCGDHCECKHACTCNMKKGPAFMLVKEEFTDLEFLTARIGSTILLILLLWACVGRSSSLILTPEGVRFPWYFFWFNRLSARKAWTRLAALSISVAQSEVVEDDREEKSQVIFDFGGRDKINIELGRISRSARSGFFEDLKSWVGTERISPEFLGLIDKHLESFSGSGEAQSFTALWEEELDSNIAATNFVPLNPGTELRSGSLKILAILLTGGLSAVYLAEKPDKTFVILKELVVPQHFSSAAKDKAIELFEREAALLMKLDHPQIAKVYDHFREGNRKYLVLEYLPGKNLRQLVKREGCIKESLVLKWAEQIASILQYLNQLTPPVIHRDLTPDNILLKTDGTIAVIDFGAANEFLGSATGTLIGKQSYISPEQFKGKASPSSDVYAFGGTLHFLLTGEDPEPLSVSHPRNLRALTTQSVDDLVAECTRLDEMDRICIDELLKRICSLKEFESDDAPSKG